MLLSRRSAGVFKQEEYDSCPQCLEWIKLDSGITVHQKSCPGKEETGSAHPTMKKCMMMQSQVMTGSFPIGGSERLRKEVSDNSTRRCVAYEGRGQQTPTEVLLIIQDETSSKNAGLGEEKYEQSVINYI